MIYVVWLVLVVSAVAGLTRLFTTDDITAALRMKVSARYGEHSMIGKGVYCTRCLSHYATIPILASALGAPTLWYLDHHLWAGVAALPTLLFALPYLAYRLLETEH